MLKINTTSFSVFLLFICSAGVYSQAKLDSLKNLLDTAKGENRLNILNAIGAEHLDKSDYEKALECYLENLKLSKVLGKSRAQARAMGNIAIVYSGIGDYDKALDYNKASLVIWDEVKDRLNKSKVLNSMGAIYGKKKDFIKAVAYFDQALTLQKEAGIKDGLATTLGNLCNCYKDLGEYQKALDYGLEGLSMAKEQNNAKSISHGYVNLATTYFKLDQYRIANAYYDSALSISLPNGFKNHSMHAYQGLFESYESMNEPAKALKYHILYQEIKDSIFSKSNTVNIANLQTKFETEQKEKENVILQKENEVRKFKQFALAAVLSLALILIVILLVNQARFKKRKQDEHIRLLMELKLLKSELLIKQQGSLREPKVGINKQKVIQQTGGKLNETDWKILNMIYENPVVTIKEIAAEVFLSVPGVKSSLKKMYKLLDIDETTENKKLAFIIKVVKISSEHS
jgi:tetratricopeptide (TPR) repeat protein